MKEADPGTGDGDLGKHLGLQVGGIISFSWPGDYLGLREWGERSAPLRTEATRREECPSPRLGWGRAETLLAFWECLLHAEGSHVTTVSRGGGIEA